MLVPCNWTAQNLRKPKWDGNFRQNHYEWAYFFEKLIDSNLIFIAVGRPNPDQCFGKSTLKSKLASTVKTGLLCNFWRCTLIVKQPLIISYYNIIKSKVLKLLQFKLYYFFGSWQHWCNQSNLIFTVAVSWYPVTKYKSSVRYNNPQWNSEKFCTLEYSRSCNSQINERWTLQVQVSTMTVDFFSPMSKEKIQKNNISWWAESYMSSKAHTACPWRYKMLISSQRNKLHMAISEMLHHKSKTVFKFRKFKTWSISYSAQTLAYNCRNTQNFSVSVTHPNIQWDCIKTYANQAPKFGLFIQFHIYQNSLELT